MRTLKYCAPFLCLSLTAVLFAKDETQILPSYVLNAHTVAVVIYPNTPEPTTGTNTNRLAREAVERELIKWGRYQPVLEATTADLVIAIRKGVQKQGEPTVSGGDINDRPVIVQSEDDNIRIGVQRGRPPVTSRTQLPEGGPRVGTATGSPEDVFDVYQGKQFYPLDSVPAFRFSGKNGLSGPNVAAVREFRKLVEATEKKMNEDKQKQKP